MRPGLSPYVSPRSGARLGEEPHHTRRRPSVTTPPDFGGHEIEEGLLEDLGGPQEEFPVSHQDGPGTDFSDNELHAAGRTCSRCGMPIQPGQDARLRADGQWIHEACPAVP